MERVYDRAQPDRFGSALQYEALLHKSLVVWDSEKKDVYDGTEGEWIDTDSLGHIPEGAE